MKSVSIIGIGWLGKQIANSLEKQGYEIKGTSRSKAKVDELSKNGWQMEQLDLLNFNNDASQYKRLFESSIVILTIPPSSLKEQYAQKMKKLLMQLYHTNPKAMVFYTSSTSVYGSYHSSLSINEGSKTNPMTTNAIEIVKVEKLIADYFKHHCVLRLGGLFGDGKNPVKYLAGRVNIPKPLAPVNLIHADDICRVIVQALKKTDQLPKIINLVAPGHPEKANFYTLAAEKMGMEKPLFAKDEQSNKEVNSIYMNKLNFKFKYTSPMDFIEISAIE